MPTVKKAKEKKNKAEITDKEKFTRWIIAQTEKARMIQDPKRKMTLVSKVEDAIAQSRSFEDEKKRDVSSVFSVILDTTVDYKRSPFASGNVLPRGAAIVLLKEFGGHNYDLNKPHIKHPSHDTYFYRPDGSHGNMADWKSYSSDKNGKDTLRLATEAEIRSFMENANVNRLMEAFGITILL